MSQKKRPRQKRAKQPHRPSARELLQQGQQLHRQGDIAGARSCYDQALALQPDNPDALHMLGLALYQGGDAQQGCACVARSLELAPDNLAAICNLASLYLATGDKDKGVAQLHKAVELAPDHGPAWRSLGDAMAAQKRLDEAARAYEQALDVWPHSVDQGSLPHNYAVTLAGLGRHEEAAQRFKEILCHQPGNLPAHCNLGHSLRELEQLEDACKAFRSALALEQDMPQAHLGLAGCLEKLGELDQGADHARRARELDPCEDTWFREAHILQEKGDYEAARRCYKKTLACNPRCVVAMNNMGVLDMNEREHDKADEWFRRARDCDPAYGEAWTNWANILEKEGDLDKAEFAARRGVELAETPSSLVRLGYVLQRQGRIDEALETYNRLLTIDPADSKGVTLYLAALGLRDMPPRASDAHVRDLFDHYAGFFERHLRESLNYKGPEVMLALLSPSLQERKVEEAATNGLDVMDLGCGTGLCGAVLSPFAKRLDGVDLSPRMLAKARERGIYHELFEAEIVQCLEGLEQDYDCVVAGDVFVYLGDLAPVFAEVHKRLRKEGLFAFTLETHENEGIKVNEGNRYQHGRGYLRALAQEYGFEVAIMEDAVMRMEAEKPVSSLAVLLRKPA